MVSTASLARAAAIGGVAVIGSSYYFKKRIETNLKGSEYFQQSLKIFRDHRGVAHFVGEPIQVGSLNLADNKNNFCTGKEAQFEVPIRGTKKEGTLYLWASRLEFGAPWDVDRLEFEVKGESDKRILVHDRAKIQDQNSANDKDQYDLES